MTNRLTVERSTTELLRNIILKFFNFIIAKNFESFQQHAGRFTGSSAHRWHTRHTQIHSPYQNPWARCVSKDFGMARDHPSHDSNGCKGPIIFFCFSSTNEKSHTDQHTRRPLVEFQMQNCVLKNYADSDSKVLKLIVRLGAASLRHRKLVHQAAHASKT